ncbi:MAG: glycosyltransferase family 39 protein [Methylococcales bacterium]|nr:glycosyltransferase family 39 protein [Methylococcales bacterium]
MLSVQRSVITNYLANAFLTQFTLSAKTRRVIWYSVVVLIMALGFYLRFKQFSFNRSLWLDEAFLATQIARGTWGSFFSMPMEYSHIAPPFFLVMCRLFVLLMGDNDLALRAYPLVTSIIAIPLFYSLARKTLSPWAVLIALLLFCTSQELTFYASNLKPYASDVMFTLLIVLAAIPLLEEGDSKKVNRRLLFLALIGLISVWFSQASIFLLASVGMYLSYHFIRQKQWPSLYKLTGIGLAWIINFGGIYFIINGGDPHKASPIADWLYIYWHHQQGFVPHTVRDGVLWLYNALMLLFKDPMGLKNNKIAGILAVFGLVSLYKHNRRLLVLCVLPLVLTLSATYFEKYVFSGRLILFLTPFAYLLVGAGLAQLAAMLLCMAQSVGWITALPTPASTTQPILSKLPPPTLPQSMSRYQKGVYVAVFSLASYLCIILLRLPFRTEHVLQEIKPALHYLQAHIHKTDKVYIFKWSEPAARYYAPLYGFQFADCHTIVPTVIKPGEFKEVDFFRQTEAGLTVDSLQKTNCVLGQAEGFNESIAELTLLKNSGTMWFLFSHIAGADEKKFTDFLDTLGKRTDEQKYPAASLYLYTF